MKFINIILISLFFSNFAYSIVDFPINGFASEYQELPQPEPEEEIAPERITQLQHSAQQVSEVIAEIQQKMASNRHLETVLTSWQKVLNHIQKIAFLLQNELYAKVAAKEQFKDFYTTFIKLTNRLDNLNKQLIVPEYKLQEQDAAKTSLVRRKADDVLNKILIEVSNTVKLHFFDNFKKIEKIYMSVAERIKQEQEVKEEQSRLEQQQSDISFGDIGYYDNYDTYDNYDSGSVDWNNYE